jgi:hydrogenase maturation protein HypF
LIADQKSFDRAAHLAYVPMPGGDAAIKSPWRMGVSLLFDALGDNFRDTGLPFLKTTGGSDIDMIVQMMRKNVNSPLTSSMGRLFDGVAAILGLYSHASFEGQAPMALENAACPDTALLGSDDVYPYALPEFSNSLNGSVAIPIHFIVSGIVSDMQHKKPLVEISTRFHWTLIHMFSALCGRVRHLSGLNRVVLSGGVFQNTILLNGMTRMLGDLNFNVYSHSRVPTNDGGISLGQAVVAGMH